MRVIAVAVTVLLGTMVPAHADEGPSPDKIESARKAALGDDYQAQLPRYEEAEAGEGGGIDKGDGHGPGSWRGPRRRGNGNVDGRDDEMVDTRMEARQGGALSGLMSLLMWGVVAVMAVLMIVWIGSELTKYGGDAEAAPSESQLDMQAAVDAIIEKPLGDADELARRGEFAEAIHTLLLRTLQELVRSSAVKVKPAMTSREILARVPLLADARDALSGLITAVEVTHFGDEPANADDYQRCRQQFNVFAQALRSSVQPQAVAA